MKSLRITWPVFAALSQKPFLRVARTAVLCLLLAAGLWSILRAFREKTFHWRGGGPMPTWLGRVMSILFGVLVIVVMLAMWNR